MTLCTQFCHRTSEFLYALIPFEAKIRPVNVKAKIGAQEALNFDCQTMMHVDPGPQFHFPKQLMVEVNLCARPPPPCRVVYKYIHRLRTGISSQSCWKRLIVDFAMAQRREVLPKSFTLPIQSFILLRNSVLHCLTKTGAVAECMEIFQSRVASRYIVHRFESKRSQSESIQHIPRVLPQSDEA